MPEITPANVTLVARPLPLLRMLFAPPTVSVAPPPRTTLPPAAPPPESDLMISLKPLRSSVAPATFARTMSEARAQGVDSAKPDRAAVDARRAGVGVHRRRERGGRGAGEVGQARGEGDLGRAVDAEDLRAGRDVGVAGDDLAGDEPGGVQHGRHRAASRGGHVQQVRPERGRWSPLPSLIRPPVPVANKLSMVRMPVPFWWRIEVGVRRADAAAHEGGIPAADDLQGAAAPGSADSSRGPCR